MKALSPIGSATERGLSVPSSFGATRAPAAFSMQWAAGFIDGEGCIHIARQTYNCGRRDTHRLRLNVQQNDLAVLEHLRDGIGIPLRINRVKRIATHNRQVYTLTYDGRKAKEAIALLLPYLVRKRAEALTALAYWVDGRVGLRPGPKGFPPELVALRERLCRKLQKLK